MKLSMGIFIDKSSEGSLIGALSDYRYREPIVCTFLLYNVHCVLCPFHYSVCSVQFALYISKLVFSSLQCKLITLWCAVCILQPVVCGM